jgi:hypothetical protein
MNPKKIKYINRRWPIKVLGVFWEKFKGMYLKAEFYKFKIIFLKI